MVCGGLQHPMVAKSGKGSLAPARPLGRSVRTVVFVGRVVANSLAYAVVESAGSFACHKLYTACG